MHIALYPGSFDPITLGHIDIINQATYVADKVIVAIGENIAKVSFCSLDDRIWMINEVISEFIDRKVCDCIKVVSFSGLMVDMAVSEGANFFIRGIRDSTDLNYEMQIASMNMALNQNIKTIFIPASPHTRYITSSLVRQVAILGGNLEPFVPSCIINKIVSVFSDRVK